jgi:hypothetical protein
MSRRVGLPGFPGAAGVSGILSRVDPLIENEVNGNIVASSLPPSQISSATVIATITSTGIQTVTVDYGITITRLLSGSGTIYSTPNNTIGISTVNSWTTNGLVAFDGSFDVREQTFQPGDVFAFTIFYQ